MVRESVEPLLDDYRPPGIKSLKFSKFSLGTVSPKIEGFPSLYVWYSILFVSCLASSLVHTLFSPSKISHNIFFPICKRKKKVHSVLAWRQLSIYVDNRSNISLNNLVVRMYMLKYSKFLNQHLNKKSFQENVFFKLSKRLGFFLYDKSVYTQHWHSACKSWEIIIIIDIISYRRLIGWNHSDSMKKKFLEISSDKYMSSSWVSSIYTWCNSHSWSQLCGIV